MLLSIDGVPAGRAPLPAVELAREADIRLGPLLIRPSRRELVARGRRWRLEPRIMQVLVALVRANGDVVSRDELIARCWRGRIVGDDAVYRCIQHLRRLAADERAFCIETISRVGYRLMPAKLCAAEAGRRPLGVGSILAVAFDGLLRRLLPRSVG